MPDILDYRGVKKPATRKRVRWHWTWLIFGPIVIVSVGGAIYVLLGLVVVFFVSYSL